MQSARSQHAEDVQVKLLRTLPCCFSLAQAFSTTKACHSPEDARQGADPGQDECPKLDPYPKLRLWEGPEVAATSCMCCGLNLKYLKSKHTISLVDACALVPTWKQARQREQLASGKCLVAVLVLSS